MESLMKLITNTLLLVVILILLTIVALPSQAIELGDELKWQEIEQNISIGEFKVADKMLQAVPESQRAGAKWRLMQARLLMSQNDLGSAEEKIESLVSEFPKNAEAFYWQGVIKGNLAQQASIFKAGSYAKQSKKSFEKATKLDPEFVPGYLGLIQFYLRAPAIAGGSTKKAIKVAESLTAINQLQGTLSQLTIAQDQDDDEWQARLVSRLQKQFPTSPEAQVAAGFYYQGQEEFEQAYKAFKVATGYNSKSAETHNESAEQAKFSAIYQLGRNAVFSELYMEEGIAALKGYLQMDVPRNMPSKEWATYRLSKLYVMTNQPKLAKPILTELSRATEDENLATLVKQELRNL